MVERSSPAAAKTLGTIFLVAGIVALALALWKQFAEGEDGTNLFIAAALLATSGLLVRKGDTQHRGDHAR